LCVRDIEYDITSQKSQSETIYIKRHIGVNGTERGRADNSKKQAQNQNGYFTSERKYLVSIWPRINIRHPPVEKIGL